MLSRLIVLAAFVALGTMVMRDITCVLMHAQHSLAAELEGTQRSVFLPALVSVTHKV